MATTNRVDFYILPDNGNQQRFVCSLVNKIWQQGNYVYVHTNSREEAGMLDDLLWTFNDISFIPHTLDDPAAGDAVPVMLGWRDKAPEHCRIMVNLSEQVPAMAEKFDRIAEIVAGDEHQKKMARQRYRDYRERGYDLHDHKIEGDYDHA